MPDRGNLSFGNVRFSSVLVITQSSLLIRLRCPFKVMILDTFEGQLPISHLREVYYVQFCPDLPYFRISEGLFPCTGFAILI